MSNDYATQAAREAAASAEVDVEATLAWRDFMVSDYSDAGQERWLADHGIDLLRAAAVGAAAGRLSAMVAASDVPKTATYTRAYADDNGFLTLLSDGELLTGAYALGPEAGEWLQQATLAIRADVGLDVLYDTIQPFPTFSEIYVAALKALRAEIAAASKPVSAGPPMAN